MIRFKVWFKTPQIVYAESELEAREVLADDFSDFNVEPDDLVAVAAGDTADRVQDFLVQYANLCEQTGLALYPHNGHPLELWNRDIAVKTELVTIMVLNDPA
mgnify:FL=1